MHPLASPRIQHANPPRPLDSQTTPHRNRIRPSTSSPPLLANPSGYSIPKLEHLFVELLFVLHEELRAFQGTYPWTMGESGEPATPPSGAIRTQRSPSCCKTPLSPSCAKATYPQLLYLSPRKNPIGGTETTKPPIHHRIRGFTRTYLVHTAGTHHATGSRSCGRSPPNSKSTPAVTMPSDTRREQPSPPHSAVDTRLAAKRAFVASRLNPKRASQSKRIGPGTRSYTSLNPNPSRTYGKNRLSSAQTAPTTFIRASPGTSTRAISSSPSYRR